MTDDRRLRCATDRRNVATMRRTYRIRCIQSACTVRYGTLLSLVLLVLLSLQPRHHGSFERGPLMYAVAMSFHPGKTNESPVPQGHMHQDASNQYNQRYDRKTEQTLWSHRPNKNYDPNSPIHTIRQRDWGVLGAAMASLHHWTTKSMFQTAWVAGGAVGPLAFTATPMVAASTTTSRALWSTLLEQGPALISNFPQGTESAVESLEKSKLTGEEQHYQPTPPSPDENSILAGTQNGTRTVQIHSFIDSRTGRLYKALNTARPKFQAFLNYLNVSSADDVSRITTVEISLHDRAQNELLRQEWRGLWRAGQLLTSLTELLASYPSDTSPDGNNNVNDGRARNNGNERHDKATPKRGGFADLLHLYCERLVSIVGEETTRVTLADGQSIQLVEWLGRTYGPDATNRLLRANLDQLSFARQLAELKIFLEWFRDQFPYYHDRCSTCGASLKEELARNPPPPVHTNAGTGTCIVAAANADAGAGSGNRDSQEHRTFLGYIYPSYDELRGKASRAELYQCHKCQSFTRFPRYNTASHVIASRRGRCGEYSMLMFLILRALGYEVRWVVDWADHVWNEVLLSVSDEDQFTTTASSTPQRRKWVHVDPCEAAIDQNHLYQGWGKKQTYILGFHVPSSSLLSSGSSSLLDSSSLISTSTAWIEDLTGSYTTDSWTDIHQRREEGASDVNHIIEQAAKTLQQRFI